MSCMNNCWDLGNRAAWVELLRTACTELGYSDPEASKSSWILEREKAIAALREICAEHGDNDWNEKLHLRDVINKHLGRHLNR